MYYSLVSQFKKNMHIYNRYKMTKSVNASSCIDFDVLYTKILVYARIEHLFELCYV